MRYSFTACVVLVLIPAFCMLSGCRENNESKAIFDNIEQKISDDPEGALKYVDSIAADSLWTGDMSRSDRARFELLQIKATDKAFVKHTSDSLILNVLDYYMRHPDAKHYTEALYYGGRVYSDLGDFPTALRYFQDALKADSEKPADNRLRSNILAQLADHLHQLKLYDEAIPFLEEDIDILKNSGDSVLLAMDDQLLGRIYLYKSNYGKADSLFKESKIMAAGKSPKYHAMADMYIAAVYYYQEDYKNALAAIRGVPERIPGLSYYEAVAYASSIYRHNEIFDSAYYYANILIESETSKNKLLGYKILLHDPLKRLIPEDSLGAYYDRYAELVENKLNKNADELAILQESMYNYSIHEEARGKAEIAASRREWIIMAILAAFFAFVAFAVFIRNRKQKEIIRLHVMLKEIDRINSMRIYDEEIKRERDDNDSQALRESIRKKVLALYEKHKNDMPLLDPVISKSEVYHTLCNHIANEECIKNKDTWKSLECVILESSPNFKTMLNVLAGEKLNRNFMEIAMLIKCGFTPKEMSILIGRAKNTITSRRTFLRNKLFENQNDNEILDSVIFLL